jgi:phosphoglycerate dehydrogenase-like enzyme
MTSPLVLQTEDLDASAAAWLAERCELVACGVDDPRFSGLLARAEGLVVRTYTRVDGALLAGAPRLRVVGRAGVGLDNIDVGACAARGVRVVHTPDANSQAVAEFVLALLVDSSRPRVMIERAVDAKEWARLRKELRAPRQLSEMTLGVLGLGRIGSRVARMGVGIGMDVLYHDIREIGEQDRGGARPVSLAELCAKADVLTLHIDPRESNRRFVNASLLAMCKPALVLINTSRGVIVDDLALAAFLRRNPRAQALLDVHEPEPFGPDYPLLGLPNAHLSPHIAAATATAQENMSWVVRDVWLVLQGQEPEFGARSGAA